MTKGIHHISAIASNGQKTVNFYAKILGLRMVKKTVNQDDPGTYHLFFGDRFGHPGMDLTFFIFQPTMQGIRGTGLVTNISLAVPEKTIEFWKKRLVKLDVKHEEIKERFGRKRIVFFDQDDQQLEIVSVPLIDIEDDKEIWATKDIAKENSVRSFYSAKLSVISKAMIEPILTKVFGYKHLTSEGHIDLYNVSDSKRGRYIEISEEPSTELGFNAAGTVHHIAFRARDQKEQTEMRKKVMNLGLSPTEVIDRFYFKSVYFRTPAGILFEIATDKPGFTADENEKDLGKKLALPPFLEPSRKVIETGLPKIST